MYALNSARPASGPTMRPETQQPHSARPSTAHSSLPHPPQHPYGVYAQPNRPHSSAASRSASASRPATGSAPWLPAAASARIVPPPPAGGLSWSVSSFSFYFPQLTFAQIQQTMSSVLPSFTSASASRQPSHEDVQQLIQRLQKLAEKHDAHTTRKQQIEERQTERRFSLFYNEPLSKSQRIANCHALKAAAEQRRAQAERQAELQMQLQIQQAQWAQDPLPTPVTSIPLVPLSEPTSSSAAAASSSPRGPRHRAAAASHELFHRKGSVGGIPAAHAQGSARTASPGSTPGSARGHARMTSGSTLGPPSRGHARRGSHMIGGAAASMHLAPTVAQSFFSVDFLREMPPRNPVAEWLAAAPVLIPTSTAAAEQADVAPTAAAAGAASPLTTPPAAKRPGAAVGAIGTTPTARPFSPLSPKSPGSGLASSSPRFNRMAKLIALSSSSPERARSPAATAPSPSALFASSDSVGAPSSQTLLSPSQEAELLSFLRSRSDCPFFARSPSAHHVPSVLNGQDLQWLVAHVLQRSVVPRAQLVSVMFSVFQNVLSCCCSGAADAPPRVFHSWAEFGNACRAIYQLGPEKYLSAIADLKTVLIDSPVFALDTGLKLSREDVPLVLESSCESGLVVPAHILSVISSFLSSSSGSGGAARGGRKFQSREEMLIAIQAGMRVSSSVRSSILSASSLDSSSKDSTERELHRRVHHLLDLFILNQGMLKAAIVAQREAADAKRRAREMSNQGSSATDSPSASPKLAHLSPSTLSSPGSGGDKMIHSNARTQSVVHVLPLTTARQCFLAILAALNDNPEAAAAALIKSNNLDEMLSRAAANSARNATSSAQLHGASSGGAGSSVQPATELLHISLASIRTFTARLRAEARIERLWLECSRGIDGVPPASATAAVAAGAHSTRAQLAIGAQDRVLALLSSPRSSVWNGAPLNASHVEQMLQAILIPAAAGTGGLRMLQHLLSRPGFMSAESAAAADGSMSSFPSAVPAAESGSNSPQQQPLAPFTKLKPLLRLLRVRAIQMHAETKRLAAFLESKGAVHAFFPMEPLPAENGGSMTVAPLETPAPLFTHADAVELMLAADCASPSDVLLHLRSLQTFGRSFLTSPASIVSRDVSAPPSVSDGTATEVLWSLAHSVRLLALAQTRRSDQGYAAGGAAAEFQIAAWIDSSAGGLFTAQPAPSIEVEHIKRWAGLIVVHRGTAASSALPGLASHALPELLLFLHHFVRTRQRFSSIPELEENLVALASQRGGVELQLRARLYALATRYSRPSESSPISPLLYALQNHPSMISKIYIESCCGPDAMRVVARLEQMAADTLNAASSNESQQDASDTVLCTWQTVEEVLSCMRAVVSAQETERLLASSSPIPSLLPVLESHLVVSEWSRPEFVSILSAQHSARSPFLHPSVAVAAASVAELEALYERLYHSLPLPEVMRLPQVLWEIASNLPWTVPTAAGPISVASISGGANLDARKFHSLDQLFHAILAVYAMESEAEMKRTVPLPSAHDAQANTASSVSPALTSLLSLLEEWLAPNLGSIFTPEAVQSLSGVINKTHAASILRASQIAARKQAAAIHHIVPQLPPSHSASPHAPLPSPLFDLSEILARTQALVTEQGLFLDFASFVDSVAHYQFVPATIRQIQAGLAAAASGTSTARSSGNGRAGGSAANGAQLSNGSNGHASAAAAATDPLLNHNLLDASAASSVSFDDVFELLDVCDCTGSPLEMLGLLRSLAVLAQSSSGALFEDMESLISGCRGIVALNRAKSLEQALVRSVVAKQLGSPRQNAQGPGSSANRARTRSRGGAATDDLDLETMAVAQLTRNIDRAAAEIFASEEESEGKDAEEEDYAFEEDDDTAAADSAAHKKQKSPPPPIDTASIQRLLHSAGAASASPLTLLATSRYFLHHLRLDFSRAAIASRAFRCGDLADLLVRFRALLWEKDRTARCIMRFVLARESKALAKGARTAMHGAAGSPAVHDWTLLDSLFAGEDAPGFACLDLLSTLGASLPDFATLPNFVDQLRLLHVQSLDEFHAPVLSAIWRIVMAAPASPAPSLAVGSASNAAAAAAASKLASASSLTNLIDAASFEATVEDMRAFWPEGETGAGAGARPAAEEVQLIRQRLQQLASDSSRFASIGALVHAYRSRFFTRPHESALSLLHTLAHPSCAIWKAEATAGLALNSQTIRSQICEVVGDAAPQILARLLMQGAQFSSIADLASAMQHTDLSAPLLRAASSSPSKSASPSPVPPQHPSALSRSFSTASQDQAREEATARALAAQRLAAEQQQAVALAKRDAELQQRFATERAALLRQLDQERSSALEKENALEAQLQALKIQLQQHQQQQQSQVQSPPVFLTETVPAASEDPEEQVAPPTQVADPVAAAVVTKLPATADVAPHADASENVDEAEPAIATQESAPAANPVVAAASADLPDDFPAELDAEDEPGN